MPEPRDKPDGNSKFGFRGAGMALMNAGTLAASCIIMICQQKRAKLC